MLTASRKTAPRLTIGLPVYNGMPLLREAIESLLAQDFDDFELIISDNASTDGTSELCRSYVQADHRVRYCRFDGNVGALRNFAHVLRDARSEYVMWAAHDDTRDGSFVARCIEALDSAPDAVLAISDISVILPNGKTSIHQFSDRIASRQARLRLGWIFRGGGWGAIYGVIRRGALLRARALTDLPAMPQGRGPDYTLVELGIIGRFVHIAEPLLTCRVRDLEPLGTIAARIEPAPVATRFATISAWLFADLWRLGRRHRVGLAARIGLEVEMLKSVVLPGSLNDVLRSWNSNAMRDASKTARWGRWTLLAVERVTLSLVPSLRKTT